MSNVIEMGEFKFSRVKPSYFGKGCKHLNMQIDDTGDLVNCEDCGKQVSSHWALLLLLDTYRTEMHKLEVARLAQKKVETTTLHLKAAQRVGEAWRSRTMVPTCPHCSEAIFPADGFGNSATNKAMALRRREMQQQARVAAATGKSATPPPPGPPKSPA